MQVQNVEVIFDIDSNNFLADGSLYVNIIETENEKLRSMAKTVSSFSFENTIARIISDSQLANQIKDESYYSNEIINFFNKNLGKKMEIIFFAESGIKGVNKVSIKDSSILYFTLYGNIKFGFLINKTIANLLFKEGNDGN